MALHLKNMKKVKSRFKYRFYSTLN
jgi:hypothetical protein